MSKRNTKRPDRARLGGKAFPQVLDRRDEAGIAEFFHSHGLALMSCVSFFL